MGHMALRRSAAFFMEARSSGLLVVGYVIGGSCGKGSNMLSEHSSEE